MANNVVYTLYLISIHSIQYIKCEIFAKKKKKLKSKIACCVRNKYYNVSGPDCILLSFVPACWMWMIDVIEQDIK